jgi:hypothetical protein
MTERMSVPPDDPRDRRIISEPVPKIIPAKSALKSGSSRGIVTWTKATQLEKIIMPTTL